MGTPLLKHCPMALQTTWQFESIHCASNKLKGQKQNNTKSHPKTAAITAKTTQHFHKQHVGYLFSTLVSTSNTLTVQNWKY